MNENIIVSYRLNNTLLLRLSGVVVSLTVSVVVVVLAAVALWRSCLEEEAEEVAVADAGSGGFLAQRPLVVAPSMGSGFCGPWALVEP